MNLFPSFFCQANIFTPLSLARYGCGASRAARPQVRLVCSQLVQVVKPTPQISIRQELVRVTTHILVACTFASSNARACRVSKKQGAHAQQQLPDVEFEECVDPGVEVRRHGLLYAEFVVQNNDHQDPSRLLLVCHCRHFTRKESSPAVARTRKEPCAILFASRFFSCHKSKEIAVYGAFRSAPACTQLHAARASSRRSACLHVLHVIGQHKGL